MKIPYSIPDQTRRTFEPSQVMIQSYGERNRRIIAEDFEWDDKINMPEPLSLLAAKVLSKLFHRINPFNVITFEIKDMLLDIYPTDIPLELSVPLIKDQQYWKNCYSAKFPNKKECSVLDWKAKFLSAYLQNYLENAKPDVFLEDEALLFTKLLSPYIYELRLNQLKMKTQPLPSNYNPIDVTDQCPFSVEKVYDHIPLDLALRNLKNLRDISISFVVKGLAEKYHPRYFKMSIEDCKSFCEGIKYLPVLRRIAINLCDLDCVKLKTIVESIITKESIEELDFSHCKIGDYGMKALAGFLSKHNSIRVIRVANNCFKEEGVQGIAYALQNKPKAPLELIDFSLNQMSIESATMLAAAFVRLHEKPQTLNLNSCGFRGESARKIVGLLELNRSLTRLNLAANNLSGAAEMALLEALELNKYLLFIDLRNTQISDETMSKVTELLKRNKQLIGLSTPIPVIPPLYLNEPEYLVWEYNPNNPDHTPGIYPRRFPVS